MVLVTFLPTPAAALNGDVFAVVNHPTLSWTSNRNIVDSVVAPASLTASSTQVTVEVSYHLDAIISDPCNHATGRVCSAVQSVSLSVTGGTSDSAITACSTGSQCAQSVPGTPHNHEIHAFGRLSATGTVNHGLLSSGSVSYKVCTRAQIHEDQDNPANGEWSDDPAVRDSFEQCTTRVVRVCPAANVVGSLLCIL